MERDDGIHTRLSAGARVTYDGQAWEVAELAPPSVLLAGAAGELRRVSISHLLAVPGTRIGDGSGAEREPYAGLVLASLGSGELARLRDRVAHVREACTGYRSGSPGLALPGEPRPEYAPGAGKLQRYQAKAAEMQVGVRTVERWAARLERYGPAGLVDERHLRGRSPQGGADARWLEMARTVLAEHTDASTPTQDLILDRIAARLDAGHGTGAVPLPGQTRARALLRELARGTSAFGGAKARREIAGRPAAPYGRLRAARPGEYLLLDTTRLDVFAMDPVTLRWVQCELTVAMDLYDRCITGLRLTPVSTKAVDAAAVLFESVRPLPGAAAGQAAGHLAYHGLPGQVIADAARLADENGRPLLPSVAAESVVVDHGKIYLSEHLMSACARLGISVQPARVYQGTDKAPLERFFRTLSEQLLAALPGYKGPDVYRRGKNPEEQAFYFLDELERIVRQWTAECYHRQPHAGLCIPEVPGLELSPLEMFAHGVAQAGFLQVPARADLVFDFLKVEWRTIQHYGVEIGGLRYDGQALNGHRNQTSPYEQQACGPLAVPGRSRGREQGLVPGPGRRFLARAEMGARRRPGRAVQQRGAGLRPPARGGCPPVPRHPPGAGGAAGAVGRGAGRRPGRAADGAAAVGAAAAPCPGPAAGSRRRPRALPRGRGRRRRRRRQAGPPVPRGRAGRFLR